MKGRREVLFGEDQLIRTTPTSDPLLLFAEEDGRCSLITSRSISKELGKYLFPARRFRLSCFPPPSLCPTARSFHESSTDDT